LIVFGEHFKNKLQY